MKSYKDVISDSHDRERPLPGEHFVPVSDGLECFGRILDAEAGGVGFPHFCTVFVPTISGDFGVGVWATKNGRPRGMKEQVVPLAVLDVQLGMFQTILNN